MKRSQIDPMPLYFDRYINLVADVELSQAMDDSIAQLGALDLDALTKLENRPYAEGKWPVQVLLQHIIDFEWVFNYRAIVFARKTGLPTQGIEEDEIAVTGKGENRKVADLVSELITLRRATKALYDSFDEEMLQTVGTTYDGNPMSVLALAFASIGHQIHHLGIVRDRYMPLLNA